MEVPHYWKVDQVQRLLDALAGHNRHQARTAALIMWRTGLRVSEVLELQWRDLDYSGEPPTLLVRMSKSRRCGILPMGSSGRGWMRSLLGLGSGELAPTAYGIVLPGIGWLQVGCR